MPEQTEQIESVTNSPIAGTTKQIWVKHNTPMMVVTQNFRNCTLFKLLHFFGFFLCLLLVFYCIDLNIYYYLFIMLPDDGNH